VEVPKPIRTSKWTVRIHLWGAIGVGYRQLVHLGEDKVNGENYRDTLKTFLIRDRKFMIEGRVFMQDNAPAHSARDTLQFLEDQGLTVMEWPPHSPDLNPIENHWGTIKNELEYVPECSEATLWDVIVDTWFEQTQESIDHLVRSFHKRLDKCVALNGDDCTLRWN
jgi:transposase